MAESKDTYEEIVHKPWVSTKDIMVLADVGRNKALEIKKAVADEIEEDGREVLNIKSLPTYDVIKYIGNDMLLKMYDHFMSQYDSR